MLSPLSTLFCVNVLSQRQTITLCPLEVTKVWTYLGLWFMNDFSWWVCARRLPDPQEREVTHLDTIPLLNYFSLDFRTNDVSHNSSKQCPPSPRRQVLGNQKDKGIYWWFTQVFLHRPHLEWLNSDRCNSQNNVFELIQIIEIEMRKNIFLLCSSMGSTAPGGIEDNDNFFILIRL